MTDKKPGFCVALNANRNHRGRNPGFLALNANCSHRGRNPGFLTCTLIQRHHQLLAVINGQGMIISQ
jgi:mannose-6-phosphate isomerase-like protein (cupin superfamily)